MGASALLDGIKVVEMGQALAGPFVGTICADLGARVIKIESPDGDAARGWGPPHIGDDASVFHYVNRDKVAVTLDLSNPDDRTRLDALLAEADVFVHNMRPGSAAKLKVDADTLCARFPRLVHGDIAAFGHVGPMKDRPGYELALQAYGGILSVTGTPEAGPMRAGPSIMDFGTGMWTALAIIAALYRRTITGKGCRIETSLLETALSWMGLHLANFATDGLMPVPMGAAHPLVAPYGAYQASDRPIIIATASDRLFERLAKALGHEEWLADPRFADNAGRVGHRAEIDAAVGAVVATRSKSDWVDLLVAAGVPCVPIQNAAELMVDPQVAALGMLAPEPGSGVAMVAMPFNVDGEKPPIRTPSPTRAETEAMRQHLDAAIAAGANPFEQLFGGSET